MTQPLNNQTVLILGGSGQMGAATARSVLRLGGSVILVGRSDERLKPLVSEMGDRASSVVADVHDPGKVTELIETSKTDHVVVAVSANAAASDIPNTPVLDAQAAFSRFWTSYAAVQTARQLPEHGSITLFSGSSARTPAPGYGVWSSLHGAIEALARAATLELAPVRVNVVSPGGIGLEPDRQLIPRRGEADDVGQAVTSLISNPAITGAVLDVDSGERKGAWSGN